MHLYYDQWQARRKQLQIGGGGAQLQIGGAHIFFFKMTDLCNEQYSMFVQIIGGGGARPPVPPYSYGPEWQNMQCSFKYFEQCSSICP